jgi:hypothetical protein
VRNSWIPLKTPEACHVCNFQTNPYGTRTRVRACHHPLGPVPTSAADDREIANALRAGGLIIVLRHGSTFRDQADTDPLHYDNIAAQRNLNDPGKATARAFGEAFRQIGVPVGEVYTSQLNRAYETAALGKDWFDVKEGEASIFKPEGDS